jgi:hypothetical protein
VPALLKWPNPYPATLCIYDRFSLDKVISWFAVVIEQGQGDERFGRIGNNPEGFGETVESIWRLRRSDLESESSSLKTFSAISSLRRLVPRLR